MKKHLLFALSLMASMVLHAQATIIFVKPDGTGDGFSWGDACSLEHALSIAVPQSPVWLQAGTYYPSKMLTIPASVKVYGGFAGTEREFSERNVKANVTIVDAQQKFGSVFRMEPASVLDGLTVQNGFANNNPHKNGGGIWAEENCLVENCKILNNRASSRGGGAYATGSLTLMGCTFEGNTAAVDGNNTYGRCAELVTPPIPMTGCNLNTPEWGSSLGTISFVSATEYPVSGNGIEQTWSSAVTATACDKETYTPGTSGTYNADCRSNSGYSGDLFSWCAVARFAQELCPAPWRIPTAADFSDLDKALGGNGSTDQMNATLLGKYANTWGVSYGGQMTPSGQSGQGTFAFFWSQTENADNSGIFLSLMSYGRVSPQGTATKDYGFTLRCVK